MPSSSCWLQLLRSILTWPSRVIVGVIVSALVFAWQAAKRIDVSVSTEEHGWKVYELRGPLFFGSIASFNEQFRSEIRP